MAVEKQVSRPMALTGETVAKPDWQRVARLLLLSREIDRLEEELMSRRDAPIRYQFSARGHELPQILLALAMDHPHDGAGLYYRSRPFALAAGIGAEEALASSFSRADTPTGGRDVGVIFNMPSRGGVTILPTPGDVGSQFSPAAGWAHAILYYQSVLHEDGWQEAMAAACGGDGSVATNGFWAALVAATTHKLPLLLLIEDNAYGISVRRELQTPSGSISRNLASFSGLRVLAGDGTDPVQTADLVRQAVGHVRSGQGPVLLHLLVERLAGHSSMDNQAYRPTEELEAAWGRDPLLRLKAIPPSAGTLTEEWWSEAEEEVRNEVQQAYRRALEWPEPAAESATRFVFFEEGEAQQVGGLLSSGPARAPKRGAGVREPASTLFHQAVRRALATELARDARILIFGEDVGVKGGVHQITDGLQERFGPERVLDTSLNEEGIIGRAAGLAMAGLMPLPEIQFRKYADAAHEALHNAGWLRWRTANRFAAPMVVRIPGGFHSKTGDPWHSLNAEVEFVHLLGWRVAFPSNARDAVGLLRSAIRGNDPTIFFEHRILMGRAVGEYPGDDFVLPFGQAAVVLEGDELTVVSWGEMLNRCLSAARAFEGRVEVIDLRTLVPLDRESLFQSVKKTGKCLIVHEDQLAAGFGAEIAALLAEHCFEWLDGPVQRLAPPDAPTPYNERLMNHVIPSAETIRERIEGLLDY